MSDDSLAQELMEESGETSQEIVDLELRLFASLISDKQGIRQYLVKNLHQHEAFDFISNAWKAAINSAQEGQVFTLETFLHLPDLTQIEKGMIESANYVPACNSIEEVEILSTQVKEKYFRNKLIKAISTPVSELSQGQLSVSDALGQLARELESISGETANTDSLGLGVGHNAMAVADAVLTESNLSIIPTGITGYDEKAGGAAKGEQIIVACPTSSGKCHGKDTPIMMFDGTIKMVQDIKKGDLLMGPDSTPRKVLGTTKGRGMLYQVTANDGAESFICNAPHVLSLRWAFNSKRSSRKQGDLINIPLNEWLNKSADFKRSAKMWRPENGIDLPAQEVPFDPYIVGAYLGDGSNLHNISNITLAHANREIVDYFQSWGATKGYSIEAKADSGASTTYYIRDEGVGQGQHRTEDGGYKSSKWRTFLREELFPNNVRTLPDLYVYNSREVRLQVLAGLLDTDGWHCNGKFEIFNKSEVLRDKIVYLARSVGLKANRREGWSDPGNGYEPGYYYGAYISGNTDIIPTKVARKQSEGWSSIKNPNYYGFTVQKKSVGDYYGFELDGDHLYLLGDFTVTHNTTFMNQLCINMGLGMVGREYKGTPRSVLYISLEMSEEEMWKRILANLCAIEVSQFRRPETFTDEQRAFIKETLVNLSNYLARVGHRFTLRGASSADIQSIRAELAAHPYDILCVDYLNLMAEGDQLWSEMGKIARELKILAQRRDFVCITAAQLDEDSLKIRYSRMVKEHCDTVLMWNLVRPEGQQEEVSSAYTEIFVDKGRNTGKFSFWVHFNFKYMMVTPVNPSQQLGLYQSPAAGQALPLPGANSIGVTHQGAQLALPNNSQPSTITQQALSPHLSAPPQQAAAQSSPLSPPVAQAAAPQQSAIDILNTSVGALTEDKGPLPGQANELDELVDARRVDMPGSLPAGVLSPNFDAFKAGDSPSGVTTMLQDIQAEAELEEVSQYDRDNVIEL